MTLNLSFFWILVLTCAVATDTDPDAAHDTNPTLENTDLGENVNSPPVTPPTTIPVVQDEWIEALDRLSPWTWATEYYSKYRGQIENDTLEVFFENTFAGRPDRLSRESAVIMCLFRHRRKDLLPKENNLHGWIQGCRNIFHGTSEDYSSGAIYAQLDALIGMAFYYNKNCQILLFLQELPFIFADRSSVLVSVKNLLCRLSSLSNTFSPIRNAIFIRLLKFHYMHDDDLHYNLLVQNNQVFYLGLLTRLTQQLTGQAMVKIETLGTPRQIITDAIDCYRHLHSKSDEMTWRVVVLPFVIQYCIDSDLPAFNLLSGLSWLSIEQLRPALLYCFQVPGFLKFLKKLSSQDLILYQKFHQALADRLLIDDVDRIAPEPPAQAKMYVRTVPNIGDEYDFEDEIGQGRYGMVFKGRCRSDPCGRPVAIKFGGSPLDDMEFLARHCHSDPIPGLVRVLDLIQENRSLSYAVLEFIEGQTLSQLRLPDDLDEAAERLAELLYRLLTTLHQLHQIGFAHGDIHFSNVMIEESTDDLILLDFGRTYRCSSPCYSDSNLLLHSLRDRICSIKQQAGFHWSDSPHVRIQQLEEFVQCMPTIFKSCHDLLNHSVFDPVRHLNRNRARANRYIDYPDLGQFNPPPPPPPLTTPSVRRTPLSGQQLQPQRQPQNMKTVTPIVAEKNLDNGQTSESESGLPSGFQEQDRAKLSMLSAELVDDAISKSILKTDDESKSDEIFSFISSSNNEEEQKEIQGDVQAEDLPVSTNQTADISTPPIEDDFHDASVPSSTSSSPVSPVIERRSDPYYQSISPTTDSSLSKNEIVLLGIVLCAIAAGFGFASYHSCCRRSGITRSHQAEHV